MKKLAILGYHKIGEPPGGWYTWNYVPAKVFETHLQYLKDEQWTVINEEQFLAGLDEPGTLPEKAVLITFDDGYKSNLQIALPILQQFSYPAIVFVPTAFVGSYNAFDADIFYEPKEDICTWEELTELVRNNISIQSHGVFHKHFSTLTYDEQLLEISQSKQLIESYLKEDVNIFSFPYGDNGSNPDRINSALKSAGYKASILYGGKSFDSFCSTPFNLPRIAVGPDTILSLELEKT